LKAQRFRRPDLTKQTCGAAANQAAKRRQPWPREAATLPEIRRFQSLNYSPLP